MKESLQPLLGMTLSELKRVVENLGLPSFTAKQIGLWLYQKKVGTIDEMSNLSKNARDVLKQNYMVGCSSPVDCQRSQDGTIKYLYRTAEGKYIETVYIPDGERATLCVSSQVGCKMNCTFCMTGRQGFNGHLSVTDILNQIYSLPEREHLTNIVFMGQGEPFDNLDNVLRATDILTADYGYAWSPKRITVSSVGLSKGLIRFLDKSNCSLAISLHSPFPDERVELMPAEKAFSIEDIVHVLERYDFCRKLRRGEVRDTSHQRRLSFEYIMFGGVNDSIKHATALVSLLRKLDCRVNLIRFHSIPNSSLKGASEIKMKEFRDYLTGHGLFTTIRASRGEDIFAACGLLSTAKQQADGDLNTSNNI